MTFILFISFIIFLRIAELFLARSNEKWALQQGAVEYGKAHYPFIVALHTTFLISVIAEYYCKPEPVCLLPLIILYLILIILKVWVIQSLGKYWNTKIYRIPGAKLVEKGPYKFVKHPNYIIVVAEIVIIPLAFQLYYTAIIFTLLNALMLYVRIKEENKILV